VEFTSNQVLVIGAGVAGLAAGQELVRAGFEPFILEARDRIGGRILTVHNPPPANPVELGAEFVHGRHPALWEVLRESGVPVDPVPGGGDWDEMDRVFDLMAKAPEQSFADFIRTVDAPDRVKQAATQYVEGFNAAPKERVGVEWLNLENAVAKEVDGSSSFRVRAGYDSVPLWLGRSLDIRLNTPVARLRWKRGQVVAETAAGDFEAPKAIVTVPLAVLFAGGVKIDPEPEVLSRARAGIGVGQAIRVTFRFPEPMRQTGFLHGDQPFRVCWTDGPAVTAWAAGPRADALAGRSEEELKRLALASVREMLQDNPGEPEGAWMHDWWNDPWSLEAYSFVCVHGVKAQQALSEAVDDTLYFAGEAVAPAGHVGTVHGAIVSGRRAARSACARLGFRLQ
jgi:monoamine oxidase